MKHPATKVLAAACAGVCVLLSGCDPKTEDAAAPSELNGERVTTDIVARASLFSDPSHLDPRISPDGEHLAWLGPVEGSMALWVAPFDAVGEGRMVASPVRGDARQIVYDYQWLGNNTHIVFRHTNVGGAGFAASSVNILTGRVRPLAVEAGVSADIIATSFSYPDDVVIAANDRDPSAYDLHRINAVTGQRERILRNDEGLTTLRVDSELRPRLGFLANSDGGASLRVRDVNGEGWSTLVTWSPEDAALSRLIGLDPAERGVYAFDTSDFDTRAIVRFDIASGERTIIGTKPDADIDEVLLHPATRAVDAFSVERFTQEWSTVSRTGALAINTLLEKLGPNFTVTSRSLDDKIWTVTAHTARGEQYIFKPSNGDLRKVFTKHEGPLPAVQRIAVLIPTPDGLDLVAHLTFPDDMDSNGDRVPDQPLPTIITLHQGPWGRARLRDMAESDWLANRGYAVIALNPRGSRGFGKTFLNAAAQEWGGKVVEDVHAGAQWAVDKGVADPDKIGLYGFFIGGSTALTALASDPDRYACAAVADAPADPTAFAETPPAYLAAFSPLFARMLGDANDEETRERLAEWRLDAVLPRLETTVLLMSSTPEPAHQSERVHAIARAAADDGAPINMMTVIPSLSAASQSELVLSTTATVEAFFGECLGGRVEDITADVKAAPPHIVVNTGGLDAIAALAPMERVVTSEPNETF